MIRYFSGANQHHLNHTYAPQEYVVRAFNHASGVPYAIGCILSPPKDHRDREELTAAIENFMLDTLAHSDIDHVENSLEHDTVIEMMDTAASIWTKKLEFDDCLNDFGEELQLGYMLVRYQDNFGRNQWSFMAAVYNGHEWLQSEEEVVPVLLSIARLS